MSYTARDLSNLVRGDDWTIKLVVNSSGSALNITGYTYWFTLKSNVDDVDPGDLQGAGNVQTLLIGKVKVVKDITRSVA